MSGLSYRADIDGLRAVAVLPVVGFHMGLAAVPGGFVGVDIFFVISGFLITTIISREIREGHFSLLTFYERRIRRLFPALFVMMPLTLLAASILFVPEDLSNAAQSGVAATLFASNILFFVEAGYFDASSYAKPLLHTWSLAIEEQFYIFMPVILMLLARLGWSFVFWVGLLTALSLALSIGLTERFPVAAYYLLPWRAWELGVGALLALGLVPALSRRRAREAAAALGLALILAGVFLIDRSTPFPGSAALLPVLGTVLLLHAGAGGNGARGNGARGNGNEGNGAEANQNGPNLISRGLSHAIPVFFGKISYSLYLWHWPVIVMFSYWKMDMPAGIEIVLLFALSVGLAWASWRFVERPFRRPAGHPAQSVGSQTGGSQSRGGQFKVLIGGAVAMAVLIGGGGWIYATRGLPGRLPDQAATLAAFSGDFHAERFRCFDHKSRDRGWGDPCIFGAGGDVAPTVALIGDSQAGALFPALEVAGREAGVAIALLGADGCPGLLGLEVYWTGHDHSCAPSQAAITGWLDAHPGVDTVIMMMRPALYTEGWLPYGFREFGRRHLTIGTDEAPVEGDARAAFFLEALSRTIAWHEQAGRRVVLVYPLPEAGNLVPRSLVRQLVQGNPIDGFGLDRGLYDRRNAPIIAGFDRLVADHGVIPLRLDQRFCGDTTCRLVDQGEPIYYDSSHLTASSARRLAPVFVPLLDGS